MAAANQVGARASAEGSGRAVAGRYAIAERLGGGAEGETFAALDLTGGDRVAVKLFRAAPADVERRVQREFERLAGLAHPGVVRVRDAGRHDGRLFLVTDLVAGAPLARVAEEGDVEVRRTRFEAVAVGLADALAYLHGKGLLHGDLSPANVRLSADGQPVLFDLAFPTLDRAGAAVGTLGYASPEALVGHVSAASDLFSLGATLFAAWTGGGPFGHGAEAAARMFAAPAPALSAVRDGLPPAWDALLAELLRPRAEDRPSSARQVLLRLGRLVGDESGQRTELVAPHPGGDPLAGIFVGRVTALEELTAALLRLAEGAATAGVIALSGVEGSGRRRLIGEAQRQHAIAAVAGRAEPLATFRGDLTALERWLAAGPDEPDAADGALAETARLEPERASQRRFARLANALEARAHDTPLLVVLEPGAIEARFASFVGGAAPGGRVTVVVPVDGPLGRVGALDVPVGPLSATDVATLATRAADTGVAPQVSKQIFTATGGHAATTAHVVRELVFAVREGRADRFSPARADGLAQRLATSFGILSTAARQSLARAALGLGDEPAGCAGLGGSSAAGDDEALRAGWLGEGEASRRLASDAHASVVMAALSDGDLRPLAEAALAHLAEDDGRRGWCLEALGRRGDAAAAYLQAGRACPPSDATQAARWFERALAAAPDALDVGARIQLADQLALEGRADDAARTLAAAAPGDDPDAALRLAERRAWLAARGGDLESARQTLEKALAAPAAALAPSARRSAALARARLARVLVAAGRFDEAIAVAGRVAGDALAEAVAFESVVLGHAYGGRLPAARTLMRAPHPAALPAPRALYLTALLDHLGGQLDAALGAYGAALAEADRAGDIHTAAAIALNLGALAAEAGRYGDALTAQDRAIRELGRLGAPELGLALFNGAMLLCELDDGAGAVRLVARLRGEPGAAPDARAAAAYLEAELATRRGDSRAAADGFARLATLAGVPPHLARAGQLARAEVLGQRGDTKEALAALEVGGNDADDEAGAPARLSRARVLMGAKIWDAHVLAALADQLSGDVRAAVTAGRRAAAWRTALAVARLRHRLGEVPRATEAFSEARRLFEEVRMSTPVDHRPGLDHDPEARFFADLARLGLGNNSGDGEALARAARSEARLRRLLRINKRLNSELRLPRLLELIMDTVIELTEAERGFILLEDDKGELVVKVARNIDQQSLQGPPGGEGGQGRGQGKDDSSGSFEVSRSIARQAAMGGGPIVTIDAAGDPRFREAMSVSDLHLRSVLAVPLQIKGRAAGTIYVDHRLRQGAFRDDDVQLVLDFAEQAAIAIENARLLNELRKRERQIDVLNRRLQGELDARKEELSGMKQELRENREALAIRYDYRNIVGRTPRMLELFRLLDRLTDTALPVVIQGESGTGKELVARALHFNGPRRQRPFVSENCAAIPETLLESTLFGAMKGAFTGADHDSRGLFEVADGGTLFLDEVGEMSPAMQGKLLRILQTGELRRVGAERTRKVDVRIIAATNRDLGRMVEEGKFRQDLFFRLSVARIALPPLRERREDIPAIVEHLLSKVAGSEPPKRVVPAALARLAAYRWPGNVRELENELMRALAFCGDSITVADLSPHVAGEAEAALTTLEDPDSLALRPRVERLERALLKEALSHSAGNQTRAAEALGLSRFGLQKKLRRYGMA